MIVRNVARYRQAVKLRKDGNSYGDIQQKTSLSKGTLSNWFSHKQWSQQITEGLKVQNQRRNTERLIELSKRRHREALQRHDEYRKEARKEYGTLKTNPLFITGIALYWGEGDKVPNGRVSLINTDITMLQTIVNFYRNILHVSNSSIRAGLFIYRDIEKSDLLEYWSSGLQIPKTQFIKIQLLPSRSILTKRKSQYGICSLYLSNTKIQIKMHEWIRLLAEDTRV